MTSWKISQLLKEFPGTVEIEENEIYSVPIIVDKVKHTILLNLPPQPGPNTPPILFCDPVIKNNSMISADGTVNLSLGEGSDGDLVAIIRKLTTVKVKPEALIESMEKIQISPVTSSKTPLDIDLSVIDDLSSDQINSLLSDEDKFHKFMKNFNHVLEERAKKVEQVKQAAREAALRNIRAKAEIEEMAKELDELNGEYTAACQSYQNFLVLHADNLSALSPENIISQIQVNLMELNDEGSGLIQTVINTASEHTNLDAELNECMKIRKNYHRRAILLKKLTE